MNLGNDKGEEKSALEQYGVDLTTKARDGKLDPVIGRDSVRRSFLFSGLDLWDISCCDLLSKQDLPMLIPEI